MKFLGAITLIAAALFGESAILAIGLYAANRIVLPPLGVEPLHYAPIFWALFWTSASMLPGFAVIALIKDIKGAMS